MSAPAKTPARKRAPAGMTLIELAIAITILSVASLAAFRSFEQAGQQAQGVLARGLAHQVALNHAAELRALGLTDGRALPDQRRMGPYDWAIRLDEAPTAGNLVEVAITVSAPDLPGARLVIYLAAAP